MELIDNVNKLLGDDLRQSITPKSRLQIAASCFSIYAYAELKEQLETIESLEFIFTTPTFVPSEVTDKLRKERREFFIPKAFRERDLYGTEFEIQLRNKLTQRAIARECADWMRRKATFRSNKTKSAIQPLISVRQRAQDVVYTPLHGFTAVDLGYQQGDAVSNLVNRFEEQVFTRTYLQVFEQVWNDPARVEDVTETICDHIASVYQENAPERVYFLMLYNIFNEFLEDISEDVLPNDLTGYKDSLVWNKLYNFQRDAAVGLINKLETHNGCILADSVGLGKTFTALAVIKYYELRNKSVLVLCPKKLANNWMNYNRNLVTNPFVKDRFGYEVLAHTDLLRTSGEAFGMPLNRINWGNYDLVVIDESHNFRNNDVYKDRETRYQRLMNSVIRSGVKTKVLMLSATPVNNRFSDLRNQLALAYEGESEKLSDQLETTRSIEEIFKRAQKVFNEWTELPPEQRTASAILNGLDFDFFKLLDSVTIARSRKHIQTFYDTADIGQFPERLKPLSFHPPLSERADILGFNEIFTRLSALKLAVYGPVKYILDSRIAHYEAIYDTDVKGGLSTLRQVDREKSLQRLMVINLLKRLESSVHAFRLTLAHLESLHANTLALIDAFEKGGQDKGIADIVSKFDDIDADDDDLPDFGDMPTTGGKIKISLADMDLPWWRHDLQEDLSIIEALLAEMRKVTPEHDAKLQHLLAHVDRKLSNPINPGNKKILLFTAFADTADYLYDQLSPRLLKRHQLNTGIVTGKDTPKCTLGKGRDFQTILTLFSPRSKEKAAILPNEPGELDVLIGTDCISEGQNLQDCDYLINYDIHWNPVRIIQRFGRIDRIGSINPRIQLVNYWPDITLDEYINLKERVEDRMVITDLTATGDDNPLSSENNDASYRKEQLRKLQDEVLDLEDVKTGVSITDLGLNDFRMDLLGYMKTDAGLTNLPNGMHAVVPADPAIGLKPGVIFALRNRNHAVNINQQNRLHPYYLIYIDHQGEVVINHMQVKALLDQLRAACRGRSTPVDSVCRVFNRATDDGKNMQHYSNLLDQAIATMIEINQENDIDSLFSGGRTSALTNTIQGLDDFELINFIVVQG